MKNKIEMMIKFIAYDVHITQPHVLDGVLVNKGPTGIITVIYSWGGGVFEK